MTVNVLGTDYTVKIVSASDEELKKIGATSGGTCHGFCDASTKRIKVSEERDGDLDDPEWYMRTTVRHELVHAFLQESGIAEQFGVNLEILVDWIAVQFPKLLKAFKAAGAL